MPLLPRVVEKPVPGCKGIGHGLLGGKGLGGNHEQGGFRAAPLQRLCDMGAINI